MVLNSKMWVFLVAVVFMSKVQASKGSMEDNLMFLLCNQFEDGTSEILIKNIVSEGMKDLKVSEEPEIKNWSLSKEQSIKGERFFIPINKLRPGQVSISYYAVCGTLKEWSEDKKSLPKLRYDNYKSMNRLERAKSVVLGPNNLIVLIDGHHTAFASLISGAKTMAVKIVEDYSNLDEITFWQKLKDESLIYLDHYEGESKKETPLSFADLINDSLRGIIGSALLEISSDDLNWTFYAPYAAGIKREKEVVPFFEFILAKEIYKLGYRVESEKSRALNYQEVSELLKYFKMLKEKDVMKKGVTLFDQSKHMDEIEMKEGVRKVKAF